MSQFTRVDLYITEDAKGLLREVAAMHGETMASYVRRVVLAQAREDERLNSHYLEALRALKRNVTIGAPDAGNNT